MDACSICGSNIKLLTHHLSYEPEILNLVCYKCHLTLHRLSRMSQKQRNIINDLVRQYGDFWENGTEKHIKSKHFKDFQKKYAKTDKCKRTRKEYKKTKKYKDYQKKYKATEEYRKYMRGYARDHYKPKVSKKNI